jgi:release factor glutamine methyltransferase
VKTIKDLLDSGVKNLSGISPTPRLDCELLLSAVTGLDKIKFISEETKEISDVEVSRFLSLLERRINFEPVAYLTGIKEFYGIEYNVNPAVLIPRPETELLVDLALKAGIAMKRPLKILDLGTGSGCIPVSLAVEFSKLQIEVTIDAVDKSAGSLEVAKINLTKFKLEKIINLIEGNWFSTLPPEKKYDLILSNPPYIAENDRNVSPETKFEPHDALFSGASGLDDIRHIITEAPKFLKTDGVLLMEIGSGQVMSLFSQLQHCKYAVFRDLSAHDRVLQITF